MELDGYIPRFTDKIIQRMLEVFGIVQVEGPKYCGKTWSSLTFAKSDINLDNPHTFERVELDPEYATEGKKPRVIDEWQKMPSIRDLLRHYVDKSVHSQGSFILTGSSSPAPTTFSHSGAGRVGRVFMRPMTLAETGTSSQKISLHGLFENKFLPSQQHTSLSEVAEWICKGGWPAVQQTTVQNAQLLTEQYLTALFKDNARQHGKTPQMAERIFFSLSRNDTEAVSLNTIASDISQGEFATKNKPARNTVQAYLDFFQDLFVLEELPAWGYALRNKNQIRVKAKYYLVDPSLAATSLKATEKTLLNDTQTMGKLFENLCIRDLKVYAQMQDDLRGAKLSYYKDNNFEVDAILQLVDGRWGAFEIKLSDKKAKNAVQNLLRLKELVAQKKEARIPEPSFLCVLTGAGDGAYRERDGVKVVPIAMLTA